MRVYFDLCALKRPFDRFSSEAVRMEALAIAALVAAVQTGGVRLVGSGVLSVENRANPDADRRAAADEVLRLASENVSFGPEAETRARALAAAGLSPPDALHVAAAESARVDLFVTADRRLLRALSRPGTTRLAVADPIEALCRVEATGGVREEEP
ncbi:MAG: PIN domain-containing protein [Deltaproteobacteria bacterium]|nr:PIN domain-containing protein [Deltaproteobacteria bacterium]